MIYALDHRGRFLLMILVLDHLRRSLFSDHAHVRDHRPCLMISRNDPGCRGAGAPRLRTRHMFSISVSMVYVLDCL